MLNEKHNNTAHWKNKLEELDSLPGEAITDKNAAWEKLHDRLREKPGRRKKTIWYWAAACLLLALSIPWIIKNKKEGTLVKNIPQQKQTNKASVPSLTKLQNKQAVVIPSMQVEKKQTSNRINKNQNITTASDTLKINEPIITVISSLNEPKPEATMKTVALDTSVAIIALAPVKKKMRVVHINELETSPEQIVSSSNHRQNGSIIKFANGNTNNLSAASQQEYAGILKIKIPLKNN